ncbi:MAG: hypothetical protein SWY16_22040 [Cyanobacteriota bacterium]|nr:hypothetical protein [Cyanobacteriota bacterium]
MYLAFTLPHLPQLLLSASPRPRVPASPRPRVFPSPPPRVKIPKVLGRDRFVW